MNLLPSYLNVAISIIASLLVSLYAVKKILLITKSRKIYDIPDNIRKIHGEQIPSLGGAAVFIGFVTIAPFFIWLYYVAWNYIIVSIVVLFFTGVYDDIMNMRPIKKLVAQLIASFITIYFADIRLIHLPGIEIVPYWLSIAITTIGCTFFINVFNFIDGIDGLACLLSILYSLVFGFIFWGIGRTDDSFIAFSLAGATAGLLFYNYPPARIYMGDTGSMVLGFMAFIFMVLVIQNPGDGTRHWVPGVYSFEKRLIIPLFSILYHPVFDAIRVFILRLSKGISPLKADRRHLHYYLLDAGLSHAQAAWLLVGVNILTILIAYLLAQAPPFINLVCFSLPCIIITIIASKMRKNKNANQPFANN